MAKLRAGRRAEGGCLSESGSQSWPGEWKGSQEQERDFLGDEMKDDAQSKAVVDEQRELVRAIDETGPGGEPGDPP